MGWIARWSLLWARRLFHGYHDSPAHTGTCPGTHKAVVGCVDSSGGPSGRKEGRERPCTDMDEDRAEYAETLA